MYMGETSCVPVDMLISKNKRVGFTDVSVQADVNERTEMVDHTQMLARYQLQRAV